jgi:hypothetical protein
MFATEFWPHFHRTKAENLGAPQDHFSLMDQIPAKRNFSLRVQTSCGIEGVKQT